MRCDRVDSAREGGMEMNGNGGMDREMWKTEMEMGSACGLCIRKM